MMQSVDNIDGNKCLNDHQKEQSSQNHHEMKGNELWEILARSEDKSQYLDKISRAHKKGVSQILRLRKKSN